MLGLRRHVRSVAAATALSTPAVGAASFPEPALQGHEPVPPAPAKDTFWVVNGKSRGLS